MQSINTNFQKQLLYLTDLQFVPYDIYTILFDSQEFLASWNLETFFKTFCWLR